MIHDYQDSGRSALYDAPRQSGLSQQHKHLKEMMAVCGLAQAPAFCPIVGDFYSGMEVTVPLFADGKKKTADYIKKVYEEKYLGPVVMFDENMGERGFISANEYSGLDIMKVGVSGNGERIILTALYDNLGKGASGAAIENLNVVTGQDETEGLKVKEEK